MKLVTFGEGAGRVGVVEGEEIAVLGVPTMREYFERGGATSTGREHALADVRLRAPIVPKKFLHTAGNFREHEEVFGETPGRDVTRWFSDASALTRYGIPTLNYGTSTGLMDVELGENLDIDGLVKTAQTYALVAEKVCG